MKDSKPTSKILKATITSLIIVTLYYLVLYLPGNVSKGALIVATLGFLLSLYFEPDFRFFRVGIISLGLYGINTLVPTFDLYINSESFLFDLVSKPDSSPNTLYLVVSAICFILDFLREKITGEFSQGTTVSLLVAMFLSLGLATLGKANISLGDINNISFFNFGNTKTVINKKSIDADLLAEKLSKKLSRSNLTFDDKNEIIRSLTNTIKDLKTNKQTKALNLLEQDKTKEARELLIQYANEEADKSSQAWVNIGNIAYLDNTQEALDAYKKAILLNPKNIDAHNSLGHISTRSGDFKGAEKAYQMVLQLAGTDQEYKAVAYGNTGRLYTIWGDFNQACKLYKKSLAIYEVLELKDGMASIYNLMGSIHVERAEYDKSLELYNKSLAVFEELDLKEGIANVYLGMGNVFNARGNIVRALEFYKKSLHFYKTLDDQLIIANIYTSMGHAYNFRDDLDKALEFYNKSLTIHIMLKLKVNLADDYNNIGTVHLKSGELDKALEFLNKSLILNKAESLKNHMADNYGNLGSVYSKLGYPNKALKFYSKSLVINKDLRIKGGEATQYANMGIIHYKLGDFDEALEMYKKSLVIEEGLARKEGMARIYANMGHVYEKQVETTLAIQVWQKSKQLYHDIGSSKMVDKVDGWINIADCKLKTTSCFIIH